MKKTVLGILIVMALCLFGGRAGIAYAESMDQETDQEMQQEMQMPSDQGTGSGQEMQQGGDTESGQGADQGTGSDQAEPAPSE